MSIAVLQGPRVGPRPPLEGQETRFDAGLLDLESDFEQITGKRFDPPTMKGTLKVKGLPNGLCVGVDQHRQVSCAVQSYFLLPSAV